MTWSALELLPRQWVNSSGNPLSGYWLIAFIHGTSNRTNMAINSSGGGSAAKFQTNSLGYLVDSGGNVIRPHINREVKLALVPTEAEADASNISNAVWPTVDNIKGIGFGETATVATLAALKALDTAIYTYATTKGYSAEGDGGDGEYWYSSGSAVTADNFKFIQPDAGSGRWILLSKYGWYNVLQGGATNDNVDTSTRLNVILNALEPGDKLFFPAGEYAIDANLDLVSNVELLGANKLSKLIWSTAVGGGDIFRQASADWENTVISGFYFDGSLTYIEDETVYKQTATNVIGAIKTSGVASRNVTIENNHFYKIGAGSIDLNGNSTANVTIRDNILEKGFYKAKGISVRTPSGDPPAENLIPSTIKIYGNKVYGGGPQSFYDPSKPDWVASTDAIDLDSCKNFQIHDNDIYDVSSIGIRAESCKKGKIYANTIKRTGAAGIACYNESKDIEISDNSVEDWGRLPPLFCPRTYSGQDYVAKEFPHSTFATLPADPSVSAWFEVWPYVKNGTLLTYSASDYDDLGSPTAIIPFRGYGGIDATSGCKRISIHGNNIRGNLTQTAGKYNFASDYGISFVHSVNYPSGSFESGDECKIGPNFIDGVRVAEIYHPQFTDPIHYTGASVEMGIAQYVGHARSAYMSTGQKVTPLNILNSTFATTASSTTGTITLTNNYFSYTIIDKLCLITGQVTVASVSSPTGTLTLQLPFANATSASEGSAKTSFYVRASGLTGAPTGQCVGEIASGNDLLHLFISDDFVESEMAANVQAGTAFQLSFSYYIA